MKTAYKETALSNFIERREYGDIIRYQDIESITNAKRGTPPYYNAIAKAKKILERHGKAIIHISGGDYQIIFPGDYTDLYADKVKRAKRRIIHGKRILENAPTKDMSEAELNTYNRVNDFNVRITAMISGCVVEVKQLTEHKHPFDAAVSNGERR